MHAEIEQDSPDRFVKVMGRSGRPLEWTSFEAIKAFQFSNNCAREQIPNGRCSGHIAAAQTHGEELIMDRCCADHFFTFRDRRREWLFAENWSAGLECPNGLLGMIPRRGC